MQPSVSVARPRSIRVFREATEHVAPVLVDFFGRRRWAILGEHAATCLEGLIAAFR